MSNNAIFCFDLDVTSLLNFFFQFFIHVSTVEKRPESSAFFVRISTNHYINLTENINDRYLAQNGLKHCAEYSHYALVQHICIEQLSYT